MSEVASSNQHRFDRLRALDQIGSRLPQVPTENGDQAPQWMVDHYLSELILDIDTRLREVEQRQEASENG